MTHEKNIFHCAYSFIIKFLFDRGFSFKNILIKSDFKCDYYNREKQVNMEY